MVDKLQCPFQCPSFGCVIHNCTPFTVVRSIHKWSIMRYDNGDNSFIDFGPNWAMKWHKNTTYCEHMFHARVGNFVVHLQHSRAFGRWQCLCRARVDRFITTDLMLQTNTFKCWNGTMQHGLHWKCHQSNASMPAHINCIFIAFVYSSDRHMYVLHAYPTEPKIKKTVQGPSRYTDLCKFRLEKSSAKKPCTKHCIALSRWTNGCILTETPEKHKSRQNQDPFLLLASTSVRMLSPERIAQIQLLDILLYIVLAIAYNDNQHFAQFNCSAASEMLQLKCRHHHYSTTNAPVLLFNCWHACKGALLCGRLCTVVPVLDKNHPMRCDKCALMCSSVTWSV